MEAPVNFNTIRMDETVWIEMPDGKRLAAAVWRPADEIPVPAILEYIPYRRRDGTAERDATMHPWFAAQGYAAVRVDLGGAGDSGGILHDEYLQTELDDAVSVIDWLAVQPWCDGGVGMMGKSWGGFNSLQVAAMNPDALKAIITVCSTDDRYADDIHYKGGCLLNENLGWAATMLSYQSRPPDPQVVGDQWKEIWLDRLENMPHLAADWLEHQRRDDYWKHGSVCEDFSAIKVPVLAVGGWGDAYVNAIPRLLKGLTSPKRALIGPWIHLYPHTAKPAPTADYLGEALRWWDHWLKGRDTGVGNDPLARVYVMDAVAPTGDYDHRSGRWVAVDNWPGDGDGGKTFWLTDDGLSPAAGKGTVEIASPQDTGSASGEYCAIWGGPDWPGDQAGDDARSVVFDGSLLDAPLEIFGAPVLKVSFEADRPAAFLAVRLNDVPPDGSVARITYHVLNLADRAGHDNRRALEPGTVYEADIQLDEIAYRVPEGHHLRVSVSTAYWPLIWPSPGAATVTLHLDKCRLCLPDIATKNDIAVSEGRVPPPLALETIDEASANRTVSIDPDTGESVLAITDDFGTVRIVPYGIVSGESVVETYRIQPDDPLSARAEMVWTQVFKSGDANVRTEARCTQTGETNAFEVISSLDAWQEEEKIFSRTWTRRIGRDLI